MSDGFCKDCPVILDEMTPEEVFGHYPDMPEEDRERFRRSYGAGIQHVSEILRTLGYGYIDPEMLALQTLIDRSKQTPERAMELARTVRILTKRIRELTEELKAQLEQQMGKERVSECLDILQGEKRES